MDKMLQSLGTAMPLRRSEVDTDQIIPAKQIITVSRTGFAASVFAGWREDPAFVLNKPEFTGATILLAGADFGIGSSREHAVWALQDYGFAVVISSRFGDIFYNNAANSGLVAAIVEESEVQQLMDIVEDQPSTEFLVDLENRHVEAGTYAVGFEMPESIRRRFLLGIDDIDLTLSQEADIVRFETSRNPNLPAITTGQEA